MNNYFDELSLSNYWKGQLPDGGMARGCYTNRIFGYIGNKLVKVLVGQRGAGKSCLLRQIMLHLLAEGVSPRNLLYISRAFTDSGCLKGREGLEALLGTYRERLHPVGKIYLFIEDIQNIDGWEQFVLSHSQDYVSSCEFFISGSNARMLDGDSGQLLLRHCVSFEIFPFSYAEYVERERTEASANSYTEYMAHGALPRLAALPAGEDHRGYVSALKNTALFRDVVQRYRIKDPGLLEEVLIYLAAHLSQSVSVTTLVSHFNTLNRKTSYDTVANYIGYLEDTFLIHRVERCQVRTREIVLGSCRYYMNDWAFMLYLYPFFARQPEVAFKNHVYMALRRAGFAVYVGVHRNKTIDFMACKDDRIIYIQCIASLADESVAEALYYSLASIQDNYEKWIVSADRAPLPSRGGIRHIQAWRLGEMLGHER